MYKTIIEMKDDLSLNALNTLHRIASEAFNNKAGKLTNVSKDPNMLIYEGGFNDYTCLQLGMFSLRQEHFFIECVKSWKWLDVNPNENQDMLEVFIRHDT